MAALDPSLNSHLHITVKIQAMCMQCLIFSSEDKHYQTNRTKQNISNHIGNYLTQLGILSS